MNYEYEKTYFLEKRSAWKNDAECTKKSATVPELAEAVEACSVYRRSRRPQVSNLPVFKFQVGGTSLKSEVWGSKSGDPISNLQD